MTKPVPGAQFCWELPIKKAGMVGYWTLAPSITEQCMNSRPCGQVGEALGSGSQARKAGSWELGVRLACTEGGDKGGSTAMELIHGAQR